jgi:histidinol-phosphatase (PHP family)
MREPHPQVGSRIESDSPGHLDRDSSDPGRDVNGTSSRVERDRADERTRWASVLDVRRMTLPPDNHVHSEWSWDAQHGSMERSCERAREIGLPSIAFTEHVDHTVWTASVAGLATVPADHPVAILADPAGHVTPPGFDVKGYLLSIERCRERFPDLRILSGVELGEPHWHSEAVQRVLSRGQFDRVLGALHCLPDGDLFQEPNDLNGHRDPAEVVRTYLQEIANLVSQSETFSVLAHIDYPVRSWPARLGPFVAKLFEDEFRHALRATARSGMALEINTVVPLQETVVRWWHEEGGEAVSFGSDAHDPSKVASGFADAAAMAQANGFRPLSDPLALWARA